MKFRSHTVPFLFALAIVTGCASTNVTQQTPMSSPGLAAAQPDLGVQLRRCARRYAR